MILGILEDRSKLFGELQVSSGSSNFLRDDLQTSPKNFELTEETSSSQKKLMAHRRNFELTHRRNFELTEKTSSSPKKLRALRRNFGLTEETSTCLLETQGSSQEDLNLRQLVKQCGPGVTQLLNGRPRAAHRADAGAP